MGGFARTYPSYETPYTVDDALGKNGWGEGYTFPCQFKHNDKGRVLISETGVSSAYCGSRLMGHESGLYTIGFPQPDENNGNGTNTVGIPLPGETPWRTITLGETLAPIVETTVPFDLVEPLYEPSQTYQYGRGSWSWIIGMDGATNYDEQKRYIDFSAVMGYQSILVDALWDTQIGRERIKELAEYGAKKGVALYLWYNSNGYWNDAPQGPRGIIDNTITRRKEMKWMKSIGIRGIKVDFFGGDKQVTMKLYEDILGGTYLANGYEAVLNESSHNLLYPKNAPEHAVVYSTENYPIEEIGIKKITGIHITDPEIHVWGLTVNSTREEVVEVMEKMGFEERHLGNDLYCGDKGQYTVIFRFSSKKIEIRYNSFGIIEYMIASNL
jgi:hypothetical protein